MTQLADTLRIDMVRGLTLTNREFIAFLLEGMRLRDLTKTEIERFKERLDRGETSRALLAIELAERARVVNQDVFLDFGAAIAEFLPKPFLVSDQETKPAERFVKLSDLSGKDDTQMVHRCVSALAGKDLSESSLEYYLEQLRSERWGRIGLVRQLVEDARAAGTRIWFDIDLDPEELIDLFGLDAVAVPARKLSAHLTKAFSATDDIFLRGWYPIEHENDLEFRWMSKSAHIRNPDPDRPLARFELFVSHIYGAQRPSVRISLDEHALEVAIEQIDGGFWVKATSINDQGSYGSSLIIESLAFGSPAVDNPESDDNRVISIAVSRGSWIYIT